MLAETVIYRSASGEDHAAIVTRVQTLDCVDLQVFGYLREGSTFTSVPRGGGNSNFRDKGVLAGSEIHPVEADPEPAAVETALEPATEPTVDPEPSTTDAEPTASE